MPEPAPASSGDPAYAGQQNMMGSGRPYASNEGCSPGAREYDVDRDRAWVASADVDLCADWPTFRAQLTRLEERMAAEPDRPAPPPVTTYAPAALVFPDGDEMYGYWF